MMEMVRDITKQETEKGEGRSWENNGKELGKPGRD